MFPGCAACSKACSTVCIAVVQKPSAAAAAVRRQVAANLQFKAGAAS
jgi:hypothetical protein